jgi:2-dehydropantoate 2-reductase
VAWIVSLSLPSPHTPRWRSLQGANLLPNGTVTHGTLEKLVFGLYLGEGQANAGANPDPEEAAFSDPAKYHDEGGAARREHGWKMTNQLELLLNAGGGGTEVVKDIQVERYKKNLWNAAWSSICVS